MTIVYNDDLWTRLFNSLFRKCSLRRRTLIQGENVIISTKTDGYLCKKFVSILSDSAIKMCPILISTNQYVRLEIAFINISLYSFSIRVQYLRFRDRTVWHIRCGTVVKKSHAESRFSHALRPLSIQTTAYHGISKVT